MTDALPYMTIQHLDSIIELASRCPACRDKNKVNNTNDLSLLCHFTGSPTAMRQTTSWSTPDCFRHA
jgi:hypothetical protein